MEEATFELKLKDSILAHLLPDLKPDVAVPVLEIILRKEGEKSSGKKENNQFV